MHFNEMAVKSRQLGLTFVAAALGVGIVLVSRGSDFAISWIRWGYYFELHVSVLLVLGAALALGAVRILDLKVYHKMLRGAVAFGEDFERNYMQQIFELENGMTQAISHFSRYEDASVSIHAKRYHYSGQRLRTAEQKIRRFYSFTQICLFAAAIGLLIMTSQLEPVGDAAGADEQGELE